MGSVAANRQLVAATARRSRIGRLPEHTAIIERHLRRGRRHGHRRHPSCFGQPCVPLQNLHQTPLLEPWLHQVHLTYHPRLAMAEEELPASGEA